MQTLVALLAGLLFGLGLTVSGMIDPAKVLGFLDIAGDWDPSLAFVMAGAIPVAAIGFVLGRRRTTPMVANAFAALSKTAIDARLVAGAVTFGIGWGLAGYCPGPALASLTLGGWRTGMFTLAMLVGMLAFRLVDTLAVKATPIGTRPVQN